MGPCCCFSLLPEAPGDALRAGAWAERRPVRLYSLLVVVRASLLVCCGARGSCHESRKLKSVQIAQDGDRGC
eukprot:7381930-Lingulodinium_polyedra.AAC.1